ncbi:P-II family nitrogen regulator [Egbenema bharatensis]|uniref:P-II family nitrogen regulator n=1 Tax=Egbenema bharatensis TaxID=3463334 RepID=UPI003A850960
MLDIDQFSLVEPAYLVTVISESVLKDSLIMLLKDLKVRSYTVSEVQGEGRYMRRSADPETSSSFVETGLEIRAIVSQELSQVILHVLKEQQTDFAIFAYRQPIEALIDDINF